MPKPIEELLDTMMGGKGEYMPVTLKPGVAGAIKDLAKKKRMSKSDALNRIVAEWLVMRKESEEAESD